MNEQKKSRNESKSKVRAILDSTAVIRKPHWQVDYPIERVSEASYHHLLKAGRSCLHAGAARHFGVILRVFEAFLAVTGQRLDFDGVTLSPISVLVDFVGAIYSEQFMFSPTTKRYTWAVHWRAVVGVVCPEAHAQIPAPNSTQPLLWFVQARARFEASQLDLVEVDLWRGWACSNGQDIAWFNLRGVYLRYGKDFAERGVSEFLCARQIKACRLAGSSIAFYK
ncbi:hypothetical protein M3I54_41940 [Paraburkholderia sp. CNPSo 3274]|uniref:hypothetical protein n=1 Tax=Paraburkholderia sp. CNPSo 3274 TaxID=2940932 RepID=UPI0020B8246D|nr:hypothetical protein [Paraburkholderia sp. CNPSo 3274]MCP3713347.1 hypothetical protein [Paraburkholderia sp. CNPSo 3274]